MLLISSYILLLISAKSCSLAPSSRPARLLQLSPVVCPAFSAPSRLSRPRGPRSSHSPTGCWPAPASPPLSLLLRDSLKAGRASFHPAKSFLSHSMCSSLLIMRAILVASSFSWCHLCTAPVAGPAPATICKFLVTPAPRSLRLFSERSSTSAVPQDSRAQTGSTEFWHIFNRTTFWFQQWLDHSVQTLQAIKRKWALN